ncbi:hypothetical protein [Ralstonia solanacearum]|uniref:hypothetical protein n=1 Tax=Ralstonia solanacearum TaxID=305 RepID=UPI0005ACA8EE|nr:hypothetical protein [Ralstonia solanacearum]
MKPTARKIRRQALLAEKPEQVAARLAVFAKFTREQAIARRSVVEPKVVGSVLAGRRVRVAG